MNKKYRQTQKSFKKSSDMKLFLIFLLLGLCGMSVFVFWAEIEKFMGIKHENKNPSGVTKNLIREDAKLYDRVMGNQRSSAREKPESHGQDKYEKEDKEYLEKLINKNL